MNIKSVDYIVTAKHYGNGSAKTYILQQREKIFRGRGIAITINDLEKPATGVPIHARIWQGQWIAECECRSASFVDPDEPIFFCFGCGNRSNNSKPRPVVFPPMLERIEIERLLMERPVDDRAGLTDLERVGMAKAVLHVSVNDEPKPLTRSWSPGETIEDLHSQQDIIIEAWRKDIKNVIR